MGPGDGIQIQRLMDLPTTLETAEPGERGPSVAVEMRDSRSHSQTKHSSLNQSSSSGISLASQQINQQGVQRVKSLLQTSAKLPSRLPPGGHSGPIAPQRSVSHNEVRCFICFLYGLYLQCLTTISWVLIFNEIRKKYLMFTN